MYGPRRPNFRDMRWQKFDCCPPWEMQIFCWNSPKNLKRRYWHLATEQLTSQLKERKETTKLPRQTIHFSVFPNVAFKTLKKTDYEHRIVSTHHQRSSLIITLLLASSLSAGIAITQVGTFAPGPPSPYTNKTENIYPKKSG